MSRAGPFPIQYLFHTCRHPQWSQKLSRPQLLPGWRGSVCVKFCGCVLRFEKTPRESRKYPHFARLLALTPRTILVHSPTTRTRSFVRNRASWPHTDHRRNVLLTAPRSATRYTQKTPCCSQQPNNKCISSSHQIPSANHKYQL